MLVSRLLLLACLLCPSGVLATRWKRSQSGNIDYNNYDSYNVHHCSADVYVMNVYPSHEHRVQVTFPRHNFTALAYKQHANAKFDVAVSDKFEVSLLSRNGNLVVPPLVRDLHSNHNFLFPQLPDCKLNIAIIADMSADGQFEFALNILEADEDEELGEQTRVIVYHGLLRFSGALDVLVSRDEDVFIVGQRLYLGLRMSGLIPAGYWLLKVVPRNAVTNIKEFIRANSLITPIELNLKPNGCYYVALHGYFDSRDFPASLAVVPASGLNETQPHVPSRSMSVTISIVPGLITLLLVSVVVL